MLHFNYWPSSQRAGGIIEFYFDWWANNHENKIIQIKQFLRHVPFHSDALILSGVDPGHPFPLQRCAFAPPWKPKPTLNQAVAWHKPRTHTHTCTHAHTVTECWESSPIWQPDSDDCVWQGVTDRSARSILNEIEKTHHADNKST